jgi:hypothetical protein
MSDTESLEWKPGTDRTLNRRNILLGSTTLVHRL